MVIIQYIAVFFMALFTDAFWTRYIQSTANNHAWKATGYSGLIMMFGIYNVLSYTQNKWMAIPIIVGGMVGTYLTIKYKDKIDKFKL